MAVTMTPLAAGGAPRLYARTTAAYMIYGLPGTLFVLIRKYLYSNGLGTTEKTISRCLYNHYTYIY